MTLRRLLLLSVTLLAVAAPAALAATYDVEAPQNAGSGRHTRELRQAGWPVGNPSAAPSWIVGGNRAAISDAPWQVDVWSENGRAVSDCGGAILDPTTILTAAHCVDGTTPGAPPTEGGLAVWAGTSSIAQRTASIDDRLALQERKVISARQHPAWRGKVSSTGDLAVLQLEKPLVFDGVRVAAIALPPEVPVPVDAQIAVPRNLIVTGFGRTSAAGEPDGRLRSLDVQVVDPDRCDDPDNAVELCTRSSRGSACSGDSGGPVTAAGIFLVGIVSNGPRSCPAGGANRYVNLYAPENRLFVLGSTAPPTAPRRTSKARFLGTTGIAPQVGQTLTCDGGGFTGATDQRTVITTINGDPILASTGRIAELQVTSDLLGGRLSCRSYASNAGGVAVSPLVTTALAVHEDVPTSQCPATRDGAPIELRAPARARAGTTIRVTATLEAPNSAASGVVLIVRPTTGGSARTRRTAAIAAPGRSARVRLAVRVPRTAKPGRRLRFQAVMATFPTRDAAESATGLGGACDAGDRTFSIRVAR